MFTSRARSDGEWSNTIQPKAKTNIVPDRHRQGRLFNLRRRLLRRPDRGKPTAFAVIPATYRLSETMRINVNGGWLWDRSVDRHYLLYGIGFDWKFTETLQWTIEAFGQAGQSDTPSVVQPRFQTGVRYRPSEIFSVDLIYGRNITGENANWITLGTTIRFPVPGGKPEHHRTGHL